MPQTLLNVWHISSMFKVLYYFSTMYNDAQRAGSMSKMERKNRIPITWLYIFGGLFYYLSCLIVYVSKHGLDWSIACTLVISE